jgi:hypothetical protein
LPRDCSQWCAACSTLLRVRGAPVLRRN